MSAVNKILAWVVGEYILALPTFLSSLCAGIIAGDGTSTVAPVAAIVLCSCAGGLGLYRRPLPNTPVTQEVIR